MSTIPVLEAESKPAPFSLRHALNSVSRTHRKGYMAQLTEMMKLIVGEGQITPRRYFDFRLYDDAEHDVADKRTFVGGRASKMLHAALNDARWDCTATDKVVFYNLMSSLGFPVPGARAIYRRFAAFPAAQSAATPAALADLLRRADIYPFFSKPVAESRGIGAASVNSYDRATDRLVFANGRQVEVDDFAAAVERFAENGYLFQERLQPHEEVARICGNRLATIRIIVLMDEAGPEIFRAVWKIPVGDHIADNFCHRGNIIAAIDPGSGRTWRAVTGGGPALRELDAHPDSDAPIRDIAVPLWPATRELCLTASTALPQIRMQAWDVAATSRGPMLIEVNTKGDLFLPQLATGQGILDARLRRFLADCGQRRRSRAGGRGLHAVTRAWRSYG